MAVAVVADDPAADAIATATPLISRIRAVIVPIAPTAAPVTP